MKMLKNVQIVMIIISDRLVRCFFVLTLLLQNVFAAEDQDYLKDLPNVTSETIRWNIPADAWRFDIPSHLMKGKLFRMEMHSEEGYAYIYDNPSLSGSPVKLHTGKKFYFNDKDMCPIPQYKRDPFRLSIFECNKYSCHQLSSEKYSGKDPSYKQGRYDDSTYLLSSENILRVCPYDLEYYVKRHLTAGDTEGTIHSFLSLFSDIDYYDFYFRYESIDKDRNYLEVKMNGKKHYIDIRGCKKNPRLCGEIDIKLSDYEKDWIAMKKHQKNKDLDYLNVLIKELKPCVVKRDIPCMKKYFLSEEEYGDYYENTNYVFPNVAANNEVLFKELEACLDYDKLLPHLLGTRGIDRVCIWNRRQIGPLAEEILKKKQEERQSDRILIMGVSFPEAVRAGSADDPIYYAL